MIQKVIERFQDEPFEWGHSDCCQFVGACIEAVTGENLALLVDYENQDDARALIDEAGGLDVVVSSVLGDAVDAAPKNNDVVMVNIDGDPAVGFVWKDVVLLRTERGLVDWPLETVELVWHL